MVKKIDIPPIFGVTSEWISLPLIFLYIFLLLENFIKNFVKTKPKKQRMKASKNWFKIKYVYEIIQI